MGWVELIGQAIKLVLTLFSVFKKSPSEKRRKSLADLDKAISKAREKNDLRELSKWFGRRL